MKVKSKYEFLRMKKEILPLFLMFTTLWGFQSCANAIDNKKDYMCFDNISYVTDYPKSLSLKADTSYVSEIVGINDFEIIDSLIIYETHESLGGWVICSLNSGKTLKAIFDKGHSKTEFSAIPQLCDGTTFFYDKKQLKTVVYDFGNGQLFEVNISNTIKKDSLHMKSLPYKVPVNLDKYIFMGDNEYYIRDMMTKSSKWYKDEEIKESEVINTLNDFEITDDFNVLGAMIRYNHEKQIFVELPVYTNYVNIFSLSTGKSKTVCMGKEMISIPTTQVMEGENFYDIRLFEDCFALLYIKNESSYPSIRFFDYEGNAIKEIFLDKNVTSFDIDTNTNTLYTFDCENETFYIYRL